MYFLGTVARCCNLYYVRSIVGYNKRKENPNQTRGKAEQQRGPCGSSERAAGNNPAHGRLRLVPYAAMRNESSTTSEAEERKHQLIVVSSETSVKTGLISRRLGWHLRKWVHMVFENLRAGPCLLADRSYGAWMCVTNRSLPAYRLVLQAYRLFLCTSDSFRILRAGPCLLTDRSSCSLDALQKGLYSFRLTCFFSLYSNF